MPEQRLYTGASEALITDLLETSPWAVRPWEKNTEITINSLTQPGSHGKQAEVKFSPFEFPGWMVDGALAHDGQLWRLVGNPLFLGDRMVNVTPDAMWPSLKQEVPANEWFTDNIGNRLPQTPDQALTTLEELNWFYTTGPGQILGASSFSGPATSLSFWKSQPEMASTRSYNFGNPWQGCDFTKRTFLIDDIEMWAREEWGNAFDKVMRIVNGEDRYPSALDAALDLLYAPGGPDDISPQLNLSKGQLDKAKVYGESLHRQKMEDVILTELVTKKDMEDQTKELLDAIGTASDDEAIG